MAGKTLKELGFDSYLDRTKLCKLIIAKRHEDAVQNLPTDTTTALGPNRLTTTNVACSQNRAREA